MTPLQTIWTGDHVIIPDMRLCFFVNRKTASTSIERAIVEALDAFAGSEGWLRIRKLPQHVQLPWPFAFGTIQWASLAVVREPVDRMMSAWADRIDDKKVKVAIKDGLRPRMPWGSFVEHVCRTPDDGLDRHFRSQSCVLQPDGRYTIPQRLIPFEYLSGNWPVVQQIVRDHCGLHLPELAHERQTPSDRKPRINAVHVEMLQKRFADDLDLWRAAHD